AASFHPPSQSLPALNIFLKRDRDRSFNYSDQLERSYPQAEFTAMAPTTAARKVSIPAILLALSVLSCLLLVHAAAAGNRKALLPRGTATSDDVDANGGQPLPTTAEEAAVGAGGEPHHDHLAGDEDVETAARRAELLQTQDYPGSGANSRHDPRNPH
ncbi:unnamed protein product, partial [Urochloa humidicola]